MASQLTNRHCSQGIVGVPMNKIALQLVSVKSDWISDLTLISSNANWDYASDSDF